MIHDNVWCAISSDTDLGAGDTDLRPSVDVDPAVGLSGDGAAHCVGDAHGQSSPLLAVAQGHQAVCSFSWQCNGREKFHQMINSHWWRLVDWLVAALRGCCVASLNVCKIFAMRKRMSCVEINLKAARLPHLTGWWRSRHHPWTRGCSCPGSRWPAPPWRAARSAPPAPGGSGRSSTTWFGITCEVFITGAKKFTPASAAQSFMVSWVPCGQTCFQRGEKKEEKRAVATHRHPSVVAGATGNEDQSPTPLDLFDVVLQSTQDYCWSHTSS